MVEVPSAKAITAFGIASGVATWLAISMISSRYPEKKLTFGSVFAATAVSVIATAGAVLLLKEVQVV